LAKGKLKGKTKKERKKTMDDTTSKTMHTVPKWDGKAKTFQLWWVRFMAFATVHRFSKALGAVRESAMPTSEDAVIAEETEEGKLQLKAKNRNANAIAQFTMAFITETAMSFIYEGMIDPDWPGGLAYLVVKAIKRKHMPDDTVSKVEKVELRRQLNGISMKKGGDPAVLGTQIASIKVRFNKPGQAIDETEFIAVVIAQVPAIYTGVLTSEQLRHGIHLRLHHLFTAMDMQWRAMGGGKHEVDDDGEIALVAAAFQGVCFICNKRGHRAHECPNKKANGNGNGKGNGYNGNVTTEKATVITVTGTTEKDFAGQRAATVQNVDIAASPITWSNSAGENPGMKTLSPTGLRRRNRRTPRWTKERHQNSFCAVWKPKLSKHNISFAA
jgi:hypothetical protein